MPRIAHKATFKATSENLTLLLAVHHVLHSSALQDENTPSNLSSDVLARNPLLFTLSGSKDGILATHDELVTSKATNHLVEYLRKNALELGLDYVSNIITSPEANESVSFTVTFAYAETMDHILMRPVLESFHLEYAWKTRQIPAKRSDAPSLGLCDHPFSRDLALPLQTLLDEVIMRFVKNSLVRRYPFIFGNLARQFNNETAYFQPMIMSIKRILSRSPDPAFRSQCRRLFKLLKHRSSLFSDSGHTTETHGRQILRQRITTEGLFYLAMQLVFKAGMKCTAFKGCTHGYIMGVEDHELLETEHPQTGIAPDWVPPLPLEDLLLDQDEDEPGLGHRESSVSDMVDFPQLGGALTHTGSPNTGELPLDTDSEDDNGLIQVDDWLLFPGISVDDSRIDLDEPDEEEVCATGPVQSPMDYAGMPSGQGELAPLALQRNLKELLEIVSSSQTRARTGIYADSTPPSMTLPANRCTPESYRGNTPNRALASHTTQQAGSGDTGTSQAKGGGYHMSYLEDWRSQVAHNHAPVVIVPASGASVPLDMEFPAELLDMGDELPFDMETAVEESSTGLLQMQIPEPDDPRGLIPHTLIASSDSPNHALHHEDFLDFLSEELSSDDEDMITGFITHRMSTRDQAGNKLHLEDEILELGDGKSGNNQPLYMADMTELFWGDRDTIQEKSQTAFMELIM